MKSHGQFILTAALGLAACSFNLSARAADPFSWPALTSENRPWTYWWWPGSAVDETNLTRELQRCHDAGLGGVHIIPIYGAKGAESNYIKYLTPRWMEMMGYTVKEARQLGLGVDMTTGTGWCFGGPNVREEDANASVVVKTFEVAAEILPEKVDPKTIKPLTAYWPDGTRMDSTGLIMTNGKMFFSLKTGTSRLYEISQKFSGQKVKRAAPGGEGPMLNLLYAEAMTNYLRWFDTAFAGYTGPKPRAQYHDSYEYKSDWSPDFFAQFEKRRGYRLQTELPALFGTNQDDHVARVKSDYRETISDLLAEGSLPRWVQWSHQHGFLTRNQAHGSPGNLLDLYALSDIPETEMFRTDRNVLIAKFASSAAHVAGKKLVSAETGTWLKEHFTETLADLKSLADDMFLAGVNHIFYHGTCYSPDEAAWPGWLFYASTEMNPRNSIWRDVTALNAYVARCQSVLQSGKSDNDILLYWPIYDYWHSPTGMVQNIRIHQPDWFDKQAIGKTAEQLWKRGYDFDYVSDRQLASAKVKGGKIEMPGGDYHVVVVPPCEHMPLATLKKLLALARSGATVIFEDHLPTDVPGWGDLEKQRDKFNKLLATLQPVSDKPGVAAHRLGRGWVLVDGLESSLAHVGVPSETMSDQPGLGFVRRTVKGGHCYFIANRSGNNFDGWLPLACAAKSVVGMDAMSGRTGVAASRQNAAHSTEVYLQLQPGESVILQALTDKPVAGPAWPYWTPPAQPVEIQGEWRVDFISGGPVLPDVWGGPPFPEGFTTTNLASWTELGVTNAQSFAGTARYSIKFDGPGENPTWRLDLGRVCQSARIKLNGRDYGTLITPPFRVVVDNLKPKDNLLEVEITNVSANRIRDLDRRGVPWKTFHDINFVDQNYKPFDASNWPLTDSGLLGPVALTAVSPFVPR